MSTSKTHKTLADFLVIAISPGLIMTLVASLVFFLVAVLYVGEYAGRLCWILFFFVFAAVLIARMSMGEEADRAGIYGFLLGVLVWIALLLYVDWKDSGGLAPLGWLLDIGLIAITWWCAHRLTWDCTLIDDELDASGTGLLQVAGLDGKAGGDPEAGQGPVEQEDEQPKVKHSGLAGWLERYRQHRATRAKRPHSPGVWVVYFSLAALPLFGIGQAIISAGSNRTPDDLAKLRSYTSWLMIVYVGSGLGLLLTTSFLGLRRYLRQRKLQMPMTMTGTWLLIGGMLIAAFLVVGALLPRPESAQRLVEWVATLNSPKRNASDMDQLGGGSGEDKGKETGKPARDKAVEKDGAGADKSGDAKDQGSQKGERGGRDGKSKDGKDGKGEKDGKDGKGQEKDGKDGKSEKDGQKSDKRDSGKSQKGSSGEKGAGSAKKPQTDKRENQDNKAEEKNDKQSEKPKGGGKASEKDGSGSQKPRSSPQQRSLPDMTKPLANILKWIVAVIAAIIVLFILLRSGLKFLANFTAWARKLLASFRAAWQSLMAWLGGRRSGSAADEDTDGDEEVPERPFADFRNPFSSGSANRMSNERLVQYCFDALAAWARERDLGRQIGETPLEFARRLGEDIPAVDISARKLATIYAQIAYARGSVNKSCRDFLRQFWQLLEEVAERPMSAGV